MKKLVIVESPSKSKTIKQYLGKDYEVLSSKGHIRDLAIAKVGGLGLDIEHDFAPHYEIIDSKENIVRTLKKAARQADEIYLATDPDREGEAISWHLEQVLDLEDKPTYRVIFNEVTEDAVTQAFKTPRSIDLQLVSSQETRRILDRIIGFKLSKLLQNKIKSKSAGRVQSAALKILVEREKEITVFVKEEYWRVKAIFDEFDAELALISGKKAKLANKEETDALLARLSDACIVTAMTKKQRRRSPKAPFITSTLQQEASNKLNLPGQKTMFLAQKLYEGVDIGHESVGLITYMRTDSTRLSDYFVRGAKAHIETTYGADYAGTVPKGKSVRKGQDAHEAIRPTSLEMTPQRVRESLGRDEYRLYKMIYERAIAALMKPLRYTTTTIELENEDTLFRASGQKLTFDGYLKAYGDYESFDSKTLPEVEEKTKIKHQKFEPTQHFTTPPDRYTEARLIKEMEECGIGRPSTYSQTITTLKNRQYVRLEEKKFIPTEQGILTIEKLDQFFSRIINVDYTARMEKVLDDIAENGTDQTKIVSEFYHAFIPLVEKANREMKKEPPKTTGEPCPKCGKPMVFRRSRYGMFEACSGYPACKYIKQEKTPADAALEKTIPCPKCGKGKIVERVAKSGRNKGNVFYACDNFPSCRHIISAKPTGESCPQCNDLLVEGHGGVIRCDDRKNCGYTENGQNG